MTIVKQIERLAKSRGKVHSIAADATITAAAIAMRDHQVGSLVVLDDTRKIAGLVTERDIINKVVSHGQAAQTVRVAAIMTRKIISCTGETTIEHARELMAAHGIRHLPIIENGHVIGMISSRDIIAQELSDVRAVVRHQSRLLQDLEHDHPGITSVHRDRGGRIVIAGG